MKIVLDNSNYGINNHVHVIIRSAGERTMPLCKQLILEQSVSADNLSIVNEAPFSAALKKSFELGMEHGLKWTLCIDADVLLRPGAVESMLHLAEQQDEQTCGIQGFILDKFIGGPRNAGVHLYRTSLLSKALEKIPPEGLNIRPESHTLEAMTASGYPWKTVPVLVGLHDFEQYYRDIFRKCFIHAHKHTDLSELFLSFWREKALTDMDYVVALQGFASGVEHLGEVFIDSRQEIYRTLLSKYQETEKEQLAVGNFSQAAIEELINNWVEPPLYQDRYPDKFGLASAANEKITPNKRISQLAADLGIFKLIPYSIGWFFQKLGKWLQDRVNSSKR